MISCVLRWRGRLMARMRLVKRKNNEIHRTVNQQEEALEDLREEMACGQSMAAEGGYESREHRDIAGTWEARRRS